MLIAFCSAHPYLPELTGGAQRSMQQLALPLIERGHEVIFLVGFSGHGLAGLAGRMKLKLGTSGFFRADFEGLKVYRCWDVAKTVAPFVKQIRPDVAVCFSGFPVPIARAFRKAGVPSVIYFRNVEDDDFGGDPSEAADLNISNSEFTADFLRSNYGLSSSVLVPLVDRTTYETVPGDRVTFINPHISKGRDVAFAMVRALPQIPFLFVRSWTLDEEGERELQAIERECPNVTVMQPTRDMKSIYAQSRIVLAPSQWQEAWGRIATEAHFSGIPVLASAIGGLPEAVGPGGILIPPEAPTEDWCAALESVWSDPERYEALADAARTYAGRKIIDPDYILSRFEDQLRELCN